MSRCLCVHVNDNVNSPVWECMCLRVCVCVCVYAGLCMGVCVNVSVMCVSGSRDRFVCECV